MQEQGSPTPEQAGSILLASGPEDQLATELLQVLRAAGLRVIFAENVSIAALMVDEAAACVAVLRPDTWKVQTIATLCRAKPACLIPVLAEPMELPRGPWTEPALDLSAHSEQGQQALLELLRARLAMYAASRPPADKARSLRPIRARTRNWRINANRLISTIVLILVILGLGIFMTYRYTTRTNAVQANPGPISTAPLASAYTAAIPGSACNPESSAQWTQGEHYIKTVNKQQIEVLDKYTTLQCQSNGALVTRSGDYDIYSELFFNGPNGEASLAPHYFAQVNATIVSGDALSSLTMDTHIQTNSYGRYSFSINAQGRWEAMVGSPKDGSPISRLAIGFLPQRSRTYTLAIEVNGPQMTFFLNGTQVTSVTDTTYSSDNDSLAFGISDATATSPVSARFSNFEYHSLPGQADPKQASATATAQAQAVAQKSYSAPVPGYGYDKAGGQWKSQAAMDTPGTLHCQTGDLQLIEPASTDMIMEEDFYWLNGRFPNNYKVSAHVDVSSAGDRCAALGTRGQEDTGTYGSYHFIICPDGSWAIVLVTDHFHTLAQGNIAAQNAYTLTAESNGSAQSLYIDGQLIKTVHDTTLTSTGYISLDVGMYTGDQQASALFSDFIFTPLP